MLGVRRARAPHCEIGAHVPAPQMPLAETVVPAARHVTILFWTPAVFAIAIFRVLPPASLSVMLHTKPSPLA